MHSHITPVFALLATLTIAAAVVAMTLRNLVHCALFLALALGGVGLLYLNLGAQFIGFAQVLVYIGAVTILILFAILLTRGSEPTGHPLLSGGWPWGVCVAGLVLIVLARAVFTSKALPESGVQSPPAAPVAAIGERLVTAYILPLEIIGLLLTAALIGAVVIALREAQGGRA